jgi:hypothetical protein
MTDEIIEKISALVRKHDTSESDVDHLMTLIRKLQEREASDKNLYPLLNLFCDWTKHSTLDRNAEGHRIVIELNNQLFLLKNVSDSDALVGGISQVISFERLQSELINFLSFHGLPLDIVTKKKLWLRFVVNLVNIVSDCDLQLPEKKTNRVPNSIKNGVVAVSLKYKWLNEGIINNLQKVSKKKVLALFIGLNDTTTIILPCKVLGKFLTAKDNKT